jgi:hypothetical protein
MSSSSNNRLLSLQTTGFLLLSSSKMVQGDNGTPMYQGNPGDIVRNLMNGDSYEEIYLKYHQCVWSEYGNSAGDYDNGCGGDGNENYWYMGRTPCYRANVAYSLYGIPKGQDTPENPCQQNQYINSFFTTHGVETFAESMGIEDYGDATDQCTVYSGGDDNANGDDGNTAVTNARLYPDYSSYTTTCATDGSFVQSLFQGSYCTTGSGEDGVTVLGELEEFNSAVENMECVQVYSSYDDQNNNNNNNNANEGEGNEEDGGNEGGSGIYGLLSYSDACSTFEYPNTCPDPFAAKHSYDFMPKSQQSMWNQMTWMDHFGWVFLVLSAVCWLIPCCSFEDDDEDKAPKKRLCLRRGEKKRQGFRGWFRTKILRRGQQNETAN